MRIAILLAAAVPSFAIAAPRPPAKLISDAGVGPITATTAPTEMAKLFPGVTSDHDEGEDHSIDRFTVGDGKHPSLVGTVDNYLNEKVFFRVDVTGSEYATAEEISPASTVADVAAAYPDLACKYEKYTPNAEDLTRALLCETSKYKHLTFFVDRKGWRGKVGPVKIAKIAKRRLSLIAWLPGKAG